MYCSETNMNFLVNICACPHLTTLSDPVEIHPPQESFPSLSPIESPFKPFCNLVSWHWDDHMDARGTCAIIGQTPVLPSRMRSVASLLFSPFHMIFSHPFEMRWDFPSIHQREWRPSPLEPMVRTQRRRAKERAWRGSRMRGMVLTSASGLGWMGGI